MVLKTALLSYSVSHIRIHSDAAHFLATRFHLRGCTREAVDTVMRLLLENRYGREVNKVG